MLFCIQKRRLPKARQAPLVRMTRHKLRKNAATYATKVIITQKRFKNNSSLTKKYYYTYGIFHYCKRRSPLRENAFTVY